MADFGNGALTRRQAVENNCHSADFLAVRKFSRCETFLITEKDPNIFR